MPRTMTTSPQRFSRPNAPPAAPLRFNYADAVQSMQANTKAHQKGKNTIKSYEGHIKRGREFLKTFATEERAAQKAFEGGVANGEHNTGEGEEEALGGEQNISTDPNFVFAFDGPPKPCTPTALALFINRKCFEEDLMGGTAYSIYSAFKWHYDTMCGDRYRGKWECDENTGRCYGNPTQSAEVSDLVESCQKKDGEKERTHSKATSIEDMEAMHAESLRVCPEDFAPRTQADIAFMTTHLLWRAVSAFGFTIWTRNFETTNFRYGGIDFAGGDRPVYGANPIDQLEFFRISLRERKNWQRKMKKGEQQMNGHVYNIYPLSASTSTPSIHLYKHLLVWLYFCEKYLLQRPWHPNDHVFPKIGKRIHPDTPMSPDAMGKFITQMATAAKIPNAELLTTHCFRRGGAQYRFMFAPLGYKWTLSRIRWWGGWALGEKRDTLIRYLLDELYTYEEDHSDALRPGDTDISSSGSHAGEALEMRPLTIAEGKQLIGGFTRNVVNHLEDSMKRQVLEMRQNLSKFPHAAHYQQSTSYPPLSIHPSAGFQQPSQAFALPPPTSRESFGATSGQLPSFHPTASPNFPHYPWALSHPTPPSHQLPWSQPFPNGEYSDIVHPFSQYHQPATVPLSALPRITQHHQTVHTSVVAYGPDSYHHPAARISSFPATPLPSHQQLPTASIVANGNSNNALAHTRMPFPHPLAVQRPPYPRQQATSSARPLPVVPSRWRIPEISHKAGWEGWRQVVCDWKVASPPEHTVPLKDWKPEWYKGVGGQHTLYLQRKTIALEFIEEFDEDTTRFLAYYGDATKNVTALFKAIQANDQAHAKRLTRAKKTQLY